MEGKAGKRGFFFYFFQKLIKEKKTSSFPFPSYSFTALLHKGNKKTEAMCLALIFIENLCIYSCRPK